MADWSQLPQELVTLIAKRLETRLDVARFRSVCSSWRCSSFLPPKAIQTFPVFPLLKLEDHTMCFVNRITRNTFYLVRLPEEAANQTAHPAPACWLLNLRDNGTKMQQLNPLADSELNFAKYLDLTNFQVIKLGHQHIGEYATSTEHGDKVTSRCYREKVAFLRSSSDDNFKMLASFRCLHSWLGFLRSGEEEWNVLEIPRNHISDIISFNGKFYAMIGNEGATMVIDQDFNHIFLEKNIGFPSSRSRNFLVRSGDDLLSVEMLFLVDDRLSSARQKVAGFRIFRLDEEEQKWDEMESLGDRIFFLGLHQSISASASEFPWRKSNLVFYCSGLSIDPVYDKSGPLFVFDLDTGTSSPLRDCPAYRNLFWPPPKWMISSGEVVISDSANYSVASAVAGIEIKAESPEKVTCARDEVSSPNSKCRFKCFCF